MLRCSLGKRKSVLRHSHRCFNFIRAVGFYPTAGNEDPPTSEFFPNQHNHAGHGRPRAPPLSISDDSSPPLPPPVTPTPWPPSPSPASASSSIASTPAPSSSSPASAPASSPTSPPSQLPPVRSSSPTPSSASSPPATHRLHPPLIRPAAALPLNLLRSLARNALPAHALSRYLRLAAAGDPSLHPDNFTYVSAGGGSPIPVVSGFQGDAFIGSALVGFYLNFSEVGDATKVFDGMFEWDTVSWNAFVSGI